MRVARYTTVEIRRLAMYCASRKRCWTSSTDWNMTAPGAELPFIVARAARPPGRVRRRRRRVVEWSAHGRPGARPSPLAARAGGRGLGAGGGAPGGRPAPRPHRAAARARVGYRARARLGRRAGRAQRVRATADRREGAAAPLAPVDRPGDRPPRSRPMTKRARLRALVTLKQGLVVPGAYDGVSVRLVERAGFPVVYMTGYGTSASRLGLPDLAFAGLGEMVDPARNLAAAVGIPLIADADTGYGNALAVRRTVALYESAGVAALHLEDQVAPKRCGHLTGHQVIALAEFEGKIRAAVEARTDPDFLIIARTDA